MGPGLGANELEKEFQDCTHQPWLLPGGRPNFQLWLMLASLSPKWTTTTQPHPQGDPPSSIGRSGLGSYRVTACMLGPGAHEILCAPFKSEVSLSPSPWGPLKLSPAGLQSQMLWGLIFLCRTPGLKELNIGLRTLIPAEPLQFVGHPSEGMGLDLIIS